MNLRVVILLGLVAAVLVVEGLDSLDRGDLEEINAKENSCAFVNNENDLDDRVSKHLKCGKIPLFCRRVCDSIPGIYFDDIKLRKISPFAFGSYKIKNNFQLVFGSNHLRRIDSDSFNGLIIESDQTLKINIGYDLKEIVSDYDDDDDEDDYDQPSTDPQDANEDNQIEYDIQIPSTKPGDDSSVQQSADSVSTTSQVATLIIGAHSFRGIEIKSGGKLILSIKNYSTVIFEENSLNSLKLMSSSSFQVNVDSASLVLFKSKSAKYWKANDEVKQDLKSKADINSVLFRLNITNVDTVMFEQDSFSDLEIAKSSTFQILIKQFDKCLLGSSSFANIKQSERSNFELNLSNGKQIETSDELFTGLAQSVNSKVVFSINSMQSDASICLKKHTFSNVKQAFNSTIRLTLSLNSRNSVILGAGALASILQSHMSHFQVYVLNANKLIVASEAVSELTQARASVFEIWSSRANSRVMFLSAAMKKVKQADDSIIRIGYVSSSSNKNSMYWQSHLMFDQFSSANGSELVYDFSQSTKFELNFPPRPIPRIMPFGLVKNNDYEEQQAPQKPQSIEEMAWRMYPELGRQSRPDIVNLKSWQIESNDFCKVSQIPFDVLVALRPSTECSCSVYYLYRVFRRVKESTDQKWLDRVPTCYKQKYLAYLKQTKSSSDFNSLNEINDLDKLEEMCKFREMIDACPRVESENVDDQVEQCSAIDHQFDFYDASVIKNKSVKKKAEKVIIVAGTTTQAAVLPNEEVYSSEVDSDNYKDNDADLDDIFSQKAEWGQIDEDDDILDEDDDDEEASIDSSSREETSDEEDETSDLYNAQNVFKNTSVLIYFIIGLTTAILAFIIVFIIIILRLKFSKRARGGFILYEEEDDDDLEDSNAHSKHHHNYYDNDELNDTVNSKQNLIESMLKKSSPHLKCNVVMECDPNSVDPVVTCSLSNGGANPYSQLTTTALNVKENPLNNL